MNRNTILSWALIVAAVAFGFAGFKYYNQSKAVRTNQVLLTQFNNLQNSEALMRSLLTETVEYAKTNPAIKPTLDAIIAKPAAATPAAAKPAGK